MYPANSTAANGKLRLLYECNPMSYIVEQVQLLRLLFPLDSNFYSAQFITDFVFNSFLKHEFKFKPKRKKF